MATSSKDEQHQVRQQQEHAQAQKRKAERRNAHERRMRQQADQAAQAKAERARRHQALKEEETRRRKEKEGRRGWGQSSTNSSGSSQSSWSEYEFYAASAAWHAQNEKICWEREAVARYEAGWERIKRAIDTSQTQLSFSDIPWPTFQRIDSLQHLSRQSIEQFILSETLIQGKEKRILLRSFMLQWHPDKFIGRWLKFVYESQRSAVADGVTLVACVANDLLASYSV